MSKFDPTTAKPEAVQAYLRKKALTYFGDAIENTVTITASHGFYSITVPRPNDYTISFSNFRKRQVNQIVKNLRILAKGTADNIEA